MTTPETATPAKPTMDITVGRINGKLALVSMAEDAMIARNFTFADIAFRAFKASLE